MKINITIDDRMLPNANRHGLWHQTELFNEHTVNNIVDSMNNERYTFVLQNYDVGTGDINVMLKEVGT